MSLQCILDDKNCIRIKNITLSLFTKHQIIGKATNLIKEITFKTDGQFISWINLGLMIMQKLNVVKISEKSCENNGLWRYEIKIQFNIVEKWLSKNRKKKLTSLQIDFVDDYLLYDVHIMMDLMSSKDEKIKSIEERILSFYDYSLDFSNQEIQKIQKNNGEMLFLHLHIYDPLVGIFIYAKDIKNIHVKPFEFTSMTVVLGEHSVSIHQEEIFQLESNIYFIPMILEKFKEEDLVNNIRNIQSYLG